MPIHPLTLAILERTGPMVVTAANATGGRAPKSLDEAVEQLGDCASVGIDVGTLGDGEMTSTVIDVTGVTPKVVREGALSVTHLREMLPELQ
jgi:tRNA A37 threonylcarbamoyladenosine synthetase subunit TsaC/SUA5/YrdC